LTASGLTKLTAHAIAKSGAMQRDNWPVAKVNASHRQQLPMPTVLVMVGLQRLHSDADATV